MTEHSTFMDRCLAGLDDPENVDDFVDAWGDSTDPRELHEALGMTTLEYSAFVRNEDALPFILQARRFDMPLASLLDAATGAGEDDLALAARSADPHVAEELRDWLRLRSK